jgi:hypothetical protein
MNQSNYRRRNNRRRKSSDYGYDSGRSEFATILLFYVLPFIVVNAIIFVLVTSIPKAAVTIGDSKDYISTTMELKVKSLLPIKEPIVTQEEEEIVLTKTGFNTYTAPIHSNGTLKVEVKAINTMGTVLYEQVDVLDDGNPSLTNPIIEDGILSFHLEDTQSGVDFSSVYLTYDDDTKELPLSIDRSTGIVTFVLRENHYTVYASDYAGNQMGLPSDPEDSPEEGTEEETESSEAESSNTVQ